MYESDDLIDQFFPDNSERRKRQKKLDIRVIVGNPPYSVGQESENDNNKNITYDKLDARIRDTYAEQSKASFSKGLYDSYVRAIRWASDRVGDSGVVGFVTNAGFIDTGTADGLRKCLANEFSRIDVLHLRGNQRTHGEKSRKEGGKIFGSGSRAPIAISFFVKNPVANYGSTIRIHDIGDYLSREAKLGKVSEFRSVLGIDQQNTWQLVKPDEHHDWINQRDETFTEFIPLGDKNSDGEKVFQNFSLGVVTARDAWCFNSSATAVKQNISRMIDGYNREVTRFNEQHSDKTTKDRNKLVANFVDSDPTRISWSRSLKQQLAKNQPPESDGTKIVRSVYRPFTKRWMYFDRRLNEMVYQMPRLFPDDTAQNRTVMIKQRWSGEGFLALMVDHPTELQTDGGAQCFPLFVYALPEEPNDKTSLFGQCDGSEAVAMDGITDRSMEHFRSAYDDSSITKEDLFYYIYGLLHSPEYRERYKDNLRKELPRIPAVKKFEDFQAYSQAGRDLAHWHLDYETVDCHPVTLDFTGGPQALSACNDEHFYVRKMKFGPGKDKTTVIYNQYITVRDIPLAAYEYIVNGKSAIEWVMERQAVTTDKKSGIVNDANAWATETMNNAAYPLELLMRIITVSLETMTIVNNLPKLDID